MNREEARQYIIERGKDHLTPDKSGKGFICPICGSGSGRKGTGITTKDGVHFTCWAGCFTNADIIDIIGLETGATDYNSKLEAAAAEYNITIEGYRRTTPQEDFAPVAEEYQKKAKSKQYTQSDIHNTAYTMQQGEAEPDYTSFFLQANRDIAKTSYHRGLTLETLNRFKLGYVESWTHPKAPQAPPSPRLIIPTSKHSYLARDTRDNLTPEQAQYAKSKVGKVRIFNSKALYTASKPVFIVEGELDALSIIDVGGEAVALGSTANRRALLTMLESQRPAQPLIIAMDNDEAGSPAAPPLYLIFAYKEKPPATASKGTLHSGKGTFYSEIGTFLSGKGTFYSGKIFFLTPEKTSNSKAFRAFCSRSKNPNILSIDY